MIESGGRNRYDRIVIVDVAPEVQIERGVARGSRAKKCCGGSRTRFRARSACATRIT
jgi:dephospho-CoA kinase